MDIYTERDNRMSEVLKKHGGFFAFSNEQFDEQREEGTKYVSMGMGLIAPKATALQLSKDMKLASKKSIEKDLATHTRGEIIHRELANHEAQITQCIDTTYEALGGYGITEEEIQVEFPRYMSHCIEHDLF